jgi:TfoX/Sxy family transcriptional regulator of competence genes
LYDNRLTLRVAEEDKARFEELVYRLRASNGEAFKLALDALTATLQDKPLS